MSETPVSAPPPQSTAPTFQSRTLVKKLAEIMGEVNRVPKSGRNEFHKYDYATESDIADAVRQGMAKRSVMLIPSVIKTEWGEIGKMRLCTLTVRFTLEDGDSGEKRELDFIGQGTDQGDKAAYKAMTGAEKYALMKLFMIPTGDDPERDDRPPEPRHQPKREEPRTQRAAPPPAVRSAVPEPATKPVAAPAAPFIPDKLCDHQWDLNGKCFVCGALEKPVKAPSAPPKQSPALRARAVKIWKSFQSAGKALDEFQSWSSVVLGRSVSSAEWTQEDVDHLENALPEALAPAEPGSAG